MSKDSVEFLTNKIAFLKETLKTYKQVEDDVKIHGNYKLSDDKLKEIRAEIELTNREIINTRVALEKLVKKGAKQ